MNNLLKDLYIHYLNTIMAIQISDFPYKIKLKWNPLNRDASGGIFCPVYPVLTIN